MRRNKEIFFDWLEKKIPGAIALGLFMVLMQSNVHAQQQELIKDYFYLSKNYQRLPMQVKMTCKSYSATPFSRKDTVQTDGEFYITSNSAYIKFGNTEQIISDTLGLLVMNDIKHMSVSAFNMPVETFMKTRMAVSSSDNNPDGFSKKYKLSRQQVETGISEIEISNRNNLPGTEIASELIHFQYNEKEKIPTKIIMLKRGLVRISDSTNQVSGSSAEMDASVKKIVIPRQGTFIIKEDVSVYEFKKITYDEKLLLPFSISDRIVKMLRENMRRFKVTLRIFYHRIKKRSKQCPEPAGRPCFTLLP